MYDLVVIGGGPAGLAAAVQAYREGLERVLILERDRELGGILNQCIHNGFGLHYFKEELTGPEYAQRFVEMLRDTRIEVRSDTMVLEITPDRRVHTVSRADGYRVLEAKAVVLAMGCRERTRGAVAIPGTRPAGIFTAGTAQRYLNIEGYMVGRRVLILGSGDIGLIMARRMTLEGAKVLACVELMPYSGGLTRNIVQCLHDYDIPLYLSHTIVDIQGGRRVERAVVARVDEDRRPVPGTEMTFDCDTILLSVGLIPENELTRRAGIRLRQLIGTCLHDLVDFVTAEGRRRGGRVCREARAPGASPRSARAAGSYTVPQRIRMDAAGSAPSCLPGEPGLWGQHGRGRRGRKRIAGFPRERLAPGEMERITLPRQLLERAPGRI
ncbi:MAG: NAD(P)/FAD-dependent oxidoreductase [Anaerotruncus massiliensis (ex Togo et al. 2019)]